MINNLENCQIGCEVYSSYDYDGMSVQEVLCQFFTKINACIDDVNQYTELVEELNKWVRGEGLENIAKETLEKWKAEGYFTELITGTIFKKFEVEQQKRVRYYNTYATMYADKTNINDGATCITQSYYTENDNGGCEYIYKNGEFNIVPKNGKLSLIQLGVKPNTGLDVTQQINDAINKCSALKISELYFNEGTYKVKRGVGDKKSIILKSNMTYKLHNNTIIQIMPTDQTHYNIFTLDKIENVTIEGGKLIGEREDHFGEGGQWGFGIAMYSARNVTIRDIEISKCWGDGLYIGADEEDRYCENITIDNVICDKNRRQGLSVISVKGLLIKDSKFNNTNGQAPQSGIDFEPNYNRQRLQDIVLENIETLGNSGDGILFYLDKFNGETTPIDITINNHKMLGGTGGFSFKSTTGVKGNITLNNPYYKIDSHNAYKFINSDNIKIVLNKPTVELSDTYGTSSTTWSHCFIFGDEGKSYTTIGNVAINNPCLVIGKSPKKLVSLIKLNNTNDIPTRFSNISMTGLNIQGDISKAGDFYIGDIGANKTALSKEANISIKDENKYFTFEYHGDYRFSDGAISLFIYKNATQARSFDLKPLLPGHVLTISSWKNNNRSFPITLNANEIDGVSSLQIDNGDIVTLRNIGDNKWRRI